MADTKQIASRIDVRAVGRLGGFRWRRRWVVSITLVVALAWAAWVLLQLRRGHSQQLFNPGPVTLAHARFEHNCAACHQPAAAGDFKQRVTDAACLSCHDAGRHQPHAMLNPADPKSAQLVNLTDRTKAADCVSCHVEHQGHDALAGSDDRLCTQCHANLNLHVAHADELPAGLATTIKSFPAEHPPFGRRLTAMGIALPDRKAAAPSEAAQPEEGWLPTLALKFNHRTHFGPESSARIESCSACHTSAPSEGRATLAMLQVERQSPPQDELQPTRPTLAPTPGGLMRPVRYEEHCRSCHPLGLPITADLRETTRALGTPMTKASTPRLAHDRMPVVRAQLADIDRLYLDLLAISPGGRDLLKDPATGAPRDPDDWLRLQKQQLAERMILDGATGAFPKDVEALAKARAKLAAETRKKKPDPDAIDDLKDAIKELEPKARNAMDSASPSAFQYAAEIIVSTKSSEANCAKCHLTEGQPSDLASYRASLKESSGKPFATLPTGGSATPRHWLAASRFDHDKHRDMACLTCHAGMDRDEDGWEKNAAGQVIARNVLRMPGIDTCAQCHKPDTATIRSAGNACVTCHDFHDRSLERPPGAPLHPLP